MSWVGDGASRSGRPELVLASASPRRLEVLRTIGIEPIVAPADVDESLLAGEKPAELVERLARVKSRTVAERFDDADRLVVGADTVIDCDGTALAKPADRADARRMLELLSGRAHGVVTGVAVAGRLGGLPVAASVVERTEVVLRTLPDDEIDWYVATGEPEGKAGAYAIQGLGSLLVEGIEGSHQNVVGLPLTALDRLLGGFGLALRELIGR